MDVSNMAICIFFWFTRNNWTLIFSSLLVWNFLSSRVKWLNIKIGFICRSALAWISLAASLYTTYSSYDVPVNHQSVDRQYLLLLLFTYYYHIHEFWFLKVNAFFLSKCQYKFCCGKKLTVSFFTFSWNNLPSITNLAPWTLIK